LANLTDTHCHLNYKLFDQDLDAVVTRAWQNGLSHILVPGIGIEACHKAVNISQNNEKIFAAVGIHPNDAKTWNNSTLTILRKLAAEPRVVAIGEIGLDYYRDRAPRDLQKEVFKAQLDLAAEVGKPVIVHSRNALDDVIAQLKEWQAHLAQQGSPLAERPGVLHSYAGDIEEAKAAISRNFYIGIGGVVTFKNAKTYQQLVAALPLDSLLVETDAPFLTPHPYRGQRNEPAHVALVGEKIAELHHKSVSEVADTTSRNAQKLFQWGDTV
jgi:TatD DNase family protein